MPRFLLDTDHFTLLERGDPRVLQRLFAEWMVDPTAVAISVVTAQESLQGRLAALSDSRVVGERRVLA